VAQWHGGIVVQWLGLQTLQSLRWTSLHDRRKISPITLLYKIVTNQVAIKKPDHLLPNYVSHVTQQPTLPRHLTAPPATDNSHSPGQNPNRQNPNGQNPNGQNQPLIVIADKTAMDKTPTTYCRCGKKPMDKTPMDKTPANKTPTT